MKKLSNNVNDMSKDHVRSGFLNSFNHFRAMAIIFIVAGHSVHASDIAEAVSAPHILFKILINGGTIFFVFISGFLFYHIFYQRYNYPKFIMGKVKNVLIPYSLFCLLPIALELTGSRNDVWNGFFLPQADGIWHEYFVPFIKYYVTGGALLAYWYIPCAMIIFLCAPLHKYFIELANVKIQIMIVAVLLIIAALGQRPIENIFIPQAVIYYTPVYLFGILCSAYKEDIYRVLKNREWLLLIPALSLAFLQLLTGPVDNYHKELFEFGGLDLQLFQKIILCVFFLVFFHRFEGFHHKFISVIAGTSFAIFFMHSYLLSILSKTKDKIGIEIPFPASWFAYPIIISSVILICVIAALITKRIFGKHSRCMIGY